jgi:diaminopimelate decarboxylase
LIPFAWDAARLTELADRHGTPCFVYDLATARADYARLRSALPARVTIAYAVKANPHEALLRTFADLGASFDCASSGELRRVESLASGRLFFTGPGKRTAELQHALDLRARIQAEGFEDLERVERLAPSRIAVNLRVHPLAAIAESTRILGGNGPSAFGVDEEDLPDLAQRVARMRRVRIAGLHVFAASNELDADRLAANHAAVFALARRMVKEFHFDLEQIDLGGGLGVAYADDVAELDVGAVGRHLERLLAENDWFQGRVIVEPGRYLAARCGVYLTRVVRTKRSRGTRFTILEAGVNHLLRPLLVGQPFPVRAVGVEGGATPTTLAGPLCTSLDRLGDVLLPELEPGALIAFGRTGAYGATEAMTKFLSHPEAIEVAV